MARCPVSGNGTWCVCTRWFGEQILVIEILQPDEQYFKINKIFNSFAEQMPHVNVHHRVPWKYSKGRVISPNWIKLNYILEALSFFPSVYHWKPRRGMFIIEGRIHKVSESGVHFWEKSMKIIISQSSGVEDMPIFKILRSTPSYLSLPE